MNKEIADKILEDYIKKYPHLSNHKLSKLVYKNEPLMFSSAEACRIRILRKRKELKIKPPEYKYLTLPKGIKNLYDDIVITGTYRILILSDIHIPFHDDENLRYILDKKEKYDIIILNGDILDVYSLSRFEKDPRLRSFAEEIKIAKLFFTYLRQKFKKAKIIYKAGNHEERYEKFLYNKAPELFGIDEYRLEKILNLDNFGIEYVDNRKVIKINELYILHGHEYGNSYSPVNPSRTIYLRSKKNTLVGHWHQPSTHQEPSIDKKFVTCWSTGCLCDLYPKWLPLNKWATGYAFLETYGSREFNVNNYKIIDRKLFNT